MEHVATRRLIEASAALDSPSRALLNLWLHRGLSDDAIAAMTRLDPGVIATRKLDLVKRLSGELGLPPDEILAALDEIVLPAQESQLADPMAEANGGMPGGSPPDETPSPAGDGGRSRRGLAIFAALVVVVAVIALSLLLVGGSSHSASQKPAETRPARASVPALVGSGEPLKPLSLRAPHATGSVTVTRVGRRRSLKLNLSVSGLPRVSTDHYEVWLYNSIIDSRPLGRLGGGVSHLSLPLPADAAVYHAIDISLQPTGYPYDSGESVLRAENPVG